MKVLILACLLFSLPAHSEVFEGSSTYDSEFPLGDMEILGTKMQGTQKAFKDCLKAFHFVCAIKSSKVGITKDVIEGDSTNEVKSEVIIQSIDSILTDQNYLKTSYFVFETHSSSYILSELERMGVTQIALSKTLDKCFKAGEHFCTLDAFSPINFFQENEKKFNPKTNRIEYVNSVNILVQGYRLF